MAELDFVYLEYDFFVDLWYNLFKYDEFRDAAGLNASAAAANGTHCSLVFAKIGEEANVGRNFDDDHEKPQFVEFSSMDSGYRVLANACYVSYHWIMDGVNEKGLVMGTANLVCRRINITGRTSIPMCPPSANIICFASPLRRAPRWGK